MFVIRRARPADKEPVREVYASAAGGAAALDEAHLDRLIRAGEVLVAEETARVIGFGTMEVGAAKNIRWLYVLPQHQVGGIGSELLKQLERIGREAGLSSIRLHAAPGAVGFYLRHGYLSVAAEEESGHDHDGVEMVKELGVEV